MTAAVAIYRGEVVHRRMRPTVHRLNYRVFSMLVDLDRLAEAHAASRFFSVNRINLFSFHEADHGDGGGLRAWVLRQLDLAGIDIAGGSIRLLCYPRILGYVFNPLSVYYCSHADGSLRAVLYEVSNTFGERHSYLIPVADPGFSPVVQHCDKRFYVSPFNPVRGAYRFKLSPPGEAIALTIDHYDENGPVLTASFAGVRAAVSDSSLLRVLCRYPLMTLKVIAGIHWEALHLWRKRTPVFERPPPPAESVTLVHPTA